MQKRFEICPTDELPPGERTIVDLNGHSVGVFNVDGEYYALKNDCPHQRAPLCMGKVTGTTSSATPGEVEWKDDGKILRCPWHGWEFDIATGESVFNPHKVRARSFDTAVESTQSGEEADANATDGGCDCGANIEGEQPPVDTYEVDVEDEQVVVYL
ncbi:Rieske [2Fe-2S] domain-containing protein [Halogranum amylolyticum]|uniref:Rieske [2Fe-2S] domain-containing protein n=1 Tax=Halogranum amylolyticum TaxID=660520 RepID=A0A1H8MUL5_9EURY|nr:Rieske (2Fe-2S) protein [Halogranum amylolyticum]SEO21047.1 Rieske [2Fe-2S] domain-containing protein [Halogranum amylolyticum]